MPSGAVSSSTLSGIISDADAIGLITGADGNDKIKISSDDTTSNFLEPKLVAGSNITLTVNNSGANETITVASTASGEDEKAKVSSNDTTAGYLNGKLLGGTGITLTESNDGGDETLTIATSDGDIDHSALTNLAWSLAGHTIDTNLDMNSNKITELAAPTIGTDAVNKTYADALVSGDADWLKTDDTTPTSLSDDIYKNGSVSIGTTTNSDRLKIKGVGSTNSTCSLVVENSNDNQMMYLCDSGCIKFGKSVTDIPVKTMDVAGNQNFDTVADPTNAESAAIGTAVGSGGTIPSGNYYYDVAYGTSDEQTSTVSSLFHQPYVTIPPGNNGEVTLSDLPLSTDPRITKRLIYRTSAGGNYYTCYLIHTINDNTTTTWIDDGSESLDTTNRNYRHANTTAGQFFVDEEKAMQISEYNTSLGVGALDSVTSGYFNVMVGADCGTSFTTGSLNTGIGTNSLVLNQSGANNVGVGAYSMYGNQTGHNNVGVGAYALRNDLNISYTGNVGVGSNALRALGTLNSNYNIGIGNEALYNLASSGAANGNIGIGYQTGKATLDQGDYNILIGYKVDTPAGTTSNFMNLGGAVFCEGLTSDGTVSSNANFGIRTNNPTHALDVNADSMRIRTAKTPSSVSDTGTQGQICWDANYIYVCTATNTWRRVAISAWL